MLIYVPVTGQVSKHKDVRIAGMEQGRKAVGRGRVKGYGRGEHCRPSQNLGGILRALALTAVEIGNIVGLTEKWCNPAAEQWSLVLF